jgi:phage portal protein BeeE
VNLLQRLKGGSGVSERMSLDEYVAQLNSFAYQGLSYQYGGLTQGIQQTLNGPATKMAPNNFVGLASQAYATNGVVFACMMVRQLVFSSVRFRWQILRNGKPSDTFGNADLALLERPWVGGTTQDLLSRMIQDADLCGNSYWTVQSGEFVHLRPDWVDVVVEPRMLRDGRGQIGWRKLGYLYTEGGIQSGNDPVPLLADEVVHFAPIPDPLACFRGMSWLTPILREIQADQAMTTHQRRFFDNAATPNMVIKHYPGGPGVQGATRESVAKWVEEFESKHGGVDNA